MTHSSAVTRTLIASAVTRLMVAGTIISTSLHGVGLRLACRASSKPTHPTKSTLTLGALVFTEGEQL
jgi:hypothetical protein